MASQLPAEFTLVAGEATQYIKSNPELKGMLKARSIIGLSKDGNFALTVVDKKLKDDKPAPAPNYFGCFSPAVAAHYDASLALYNRDQIIWESAKVSPVPTFAFFCKNGNIICGLASMSGPPTVYIVSGKNGAIDKLCSGELFIEKTGVTEYLITTTKTATRKLKPADATYGDLIAAAAGVERWVGVGDKKRLGGPTSYSISAFIVSSETAEVISKIDSFQVVPYSWPRTRYSADDRFRLLPEEFSKDYSFSEEIRLINRISKSLDVTIKSEACRDAYMSIRTSLQKEIIASLDDEDLRALSRRIEKSKENRRI